MRVNSEAEMLQFGVDFAKSFNLPAVIELVGDVGAGKTTFTRGLAAGLGVMEPITSPSFTISKRYAFPNGELIHYDFYRLDDPGIMRDELSDALGQSDSVIVVEWGGNIADLLPATKYRLEISQIDANERELQIFQGTENVTNLWKTCGKPANKCGKLVEKFDDSCVKAVDNSQISTAEPKGDQ